MASRAQAESGGGGGTLGALFILFIIAMLILLSAGAALDGAAGATTSDYQLGNVEIQERVDNHVVEKHGTKARDVLNRPGTREYWYSASRETVMVAKCDASTCACSFIAGRGLPWGQVPFDPSWLNGQLELTTYFMQVVAKISVVQRDGYAFLGTW